MIRSAVAVFALAAGGLLSAQPMDLFLLIGQSNMAGRGAIEAQDREPNPQVFMFTKEDQWAPAVEPVHFDRPDRLGTGLGRTFGIVIAGQTPGRRIGLIPAAMGGSALDEWKPGEKLYTEAVRRARLAMKEGRLRGILWHQGESDANSLEKVRSYRQRWMAVMDALRKDLNAAGVPIIVGQLGEFLYTREKNDYPYARLLNEELALLPVFYPKVGFVSSAGLGHKGDVLHFDAQAFREFGRRYAFTFLAVESR